MDQVTAREFETAIGALTAEIRNGFAGAHARLDKVNGRLDRHGQAIAALEPLVARHDERLTGHDREFGQIGKNRLVSPAPGGITINVPTDAKTLAAIAGALALVGMMLLKSGAL